MFLVITHPLIFLGLVSWPWVSPRSGPAIGMSLRSFLDLLDEVRSRVQITLTPSDIVWLFKIISKCFIAYLLIILRLSLAKTFEDRLEQRWQEILFLIHIRFFSKQFLFLIGTYNNHGIKNSFEKIFMWKLQKWSIKKGIYTLSNFKAVSKGPKIKNFTLF